MFVALQDYYCRGMNKTKKPINFNTKPKLFFLTNLNRLLKQLEREIVERAIVCLETGEQKFRDKDPFTTDYMVEAKVKYCLKKSDEPSHTYDQYFKYKSTVVEKDYSLLLSDEDWHEEGTIWPKLEEPYCYLLHDLLYHSRLINKVFDIRMVWVDIIVSDQKLIKVKKNGQYSTMYYDEKKREFV